MAAGGHGNKAVIAALFANLGIAIAKLIGFFITRSSSMLAEAVHSAADSGNQALLLLGGKRARRAATELHQFGFGRERYFWSFVVALVLFVLGAAFATYEGIEKIRHPHELESPGVAIGILVVGIVLETLSFRTAIVEARPLKGASSWWRFVRTSRTPELPVVLLEDLGALAGLVIALLAVVTSTVTGDAVYDGIGTLVIGLLLGVIAVILVIEMKGLLIGESATEADQAAIRTAIEGTPSVRHLIQLRTQHLGPDELLVGAKVAFDASLDVGALAAAVDEVERRIRDVVPAARPCYVEPDLLRQTVDAGTTSTAPQH